MEKWYTEIRQRACRVGSSLKFLTPFFQRTASEMSRWEHVWHAGPTLAQNVARRQEFKVKEPKHRAVDKHENKKKLEPIGHQAK